MKTQRHDTIQTGKYANEMWNNVEKIDPAYILWAQNTKKDVHFSKNFLDAAGIHLLDTQTRHFRDRSFFNE